MSSSSFWIKTSLFFILLFGYKSSIAQKDKVTFKHLTVENGLSQSSVLSIAQDSMGFMWFGTKDGLNKYNTRNFEIYKREKGNSSSLSSAQNINALLTDTKGNLWVGTQKGLNKYLPESNSFKRYVYDSENQKSISNNIIRSLFEDNKGQLWVGTDSGLNKLNNDDTFTRFLPGKDKNISLADHLVKDKSSSKKGAFYFKLDKKKYQANFQAFLNIIPNPDKLLAV